MAGIKNASAYECELHINPYNGEARATIYKADVRQGSYLKTDSNLKLSSSSFNGMKTDNPYPGTTGTYTASAYSDDESELFKEWTIRVSITGWNGTVPRGDCTATESRRNLSAPIIQR